MESRAVEWIQYSTVPALALLLPLGVLIVADAKFCVYTGAPISNGKTKPAAQDSRSGRNTAKRHGPLFLMPKNRHC